MTALIHTNTPAAAQVQALADAIHPGGNLHAALRDAVLELHTVTTPGQYGTAIAHLLDAHIAMQDWMAAVTQTANRMDMRDAAKALDNGHETAA